jgi:glycosyltransferase involved in cell wall biosynthesis
LHGGVSRREALSALRGAAVAVVITSIAEEASLEDRGIVTGKIFEAVGLGTPVLAVAPRGSDIEEILERTRLGQRFAGSEIDQMEEFLVRAIDLPRLQSSEREVYSWANIARRLDDVLRGASIVETRREQAEQPRQHEGLDSPGDPKRISLPATDEPVRNRGVEER